MMGCADGGGRYDLTSVWGEAFDGIPLSVTPSDTGEATIVWPGGVSPGASNIQMGRYVRRVSALWMERLTPG
jgi:hypothetical protein